MATLQIFIWFCFLVTFDGLIGVLKLPSSAVDVQQLEHETLLYSSEPQSGWASLSTRSSSLTIVLVVLFAIK